MSRQKFQTGATWPDGTDQDTAPFGAGLKYQYSTDTASSDPTSGFLKFNNTTLSSITSLRISETDGYGTSIASLIQQLDDNGTSIRANVFMVKESDPSTYLIFNIAGIFTDNGTWDSCTISFVASRGTFSNNDVVRISFCRTGATGASGSSGNQSWAWIKLAGTTPPSFAGDFTHNHATDLASATQLYLAHGTDAQGDPSTIFIAWETDARRGVIKATNAADATNWYYLYFTSVDDISTYTKFNLVYLDNQGSTPATGATWRFEIIPWPLASEIVGGGGGGSTDVGMIWALSV